MPKYNHPPSFPLYPQHLAADGKVEAMTTEEFGAYMLLLCKAWYEEPVATIPDDDWTLARWTRLTLGRWKKCKPRVLAAFRNRDNGRYLQPRLRDEFERLRTHSKRRSLAGKRGSDKRWGSKGKDGNDGNAIAGPKQSHSNANADALANDSSSPSPSPSTTNQPTRASPDGGLVGDALMQKNDNSQDPVIEALTRAGVAKRNRLELAALPGLTAEIIDRVDQEVRQGRGGTGAVVEQIRVESEAFVAKERVVEKRKAYLDAEGENRRNEMAASAAADTELIERLGAIPDADRERLVTMVLETDPWFIEHPSISRDPFKDTLLRSTVLRAWCKEQELTP